MRTYNTQKFCEFYFNPIALINKNNCVYSVIIDCASSTTKPHGGELNITSRRRIPSFRLVKNHYLLTSALIENEVYPQMRCFHCSVLISYLR